MSSQQEPPDDITLPHRQNEAANSAHLLATSRFRAGQVTNTRNDLALIGQSVQQEKLNSWTGAECTPGPRTPRTAILLTCVTRCTLVYRIGSRSRLHCVQAASLTSTPTYLTLPTENRSYAGNGKPHQAIRCAQKQKDELDDCAGAATELQLPGQSGPRDTSPDGKIAATPRPQL